PIDGHGPLKAAARREVYGVPPNPLYRRRITEPLPTGVRAIDGLLTLGKGQRMGIFAGSGVGKSVLLGMIARNTSADVNVVALIGERGREVREFLEKDLGEEGLRRSVVIVATSDRPPLERIKAALVAISVAEYFRDQGKDVMFLMDSLTRVAMAQREVGLSVGEPPTSRGYTPSVFTFMAKFLERAGSSSRGSITGLYTVLVEGDDLDEPISDAARSFLDGHIVLSRKLASMGHYPAIDPLYSVSRVMVDVVSPEHLKAARRAVGILATYREAEDLIQLGAYKQGSNPRVDEAIERIEDVRRYLKQDMYERAEFEESVQRLLTMFPN
ncbi:MAG: EscN/YscN/HrcN family type III secretion system ATPase, partial [Candidatus Latescibacterota bacterium]